jgi:hypothetical protein
LTPKKAAGPPNKRSRRFTFIQASEVVTRYVIIDP